MPQPKSARKRSGKQGQKARTQKAKSTPGPVGTVLDAVRGSLGIVVIPRDRLQEVFDDAVARGRMTRGDAQDLVRSLVSRGLKEPQRLMSDVEQLLGRGRDQLESSARQAPGSDRAIRELDRMRRSAGLPPNFPIIGYDDLTAAQITTRLGDLTAAELRKVRDYERRHGNRKSVLAAIEKSLG